MTDVFRFDAKQVFLTYPRTGELGIDSVAGHLQSLGCDGHVVGRETHADGEYHIHAYGRWTSRFCSRNQRIFDVNGRHPNIQSVRNATHVITYVKKGGDFVSTIEDGSRPERYHDLIEAATEDEFWKIAKARYARDYVIHFDRLQHFCEHRFTKHQDHYVGRFTEFKPPRPVKLWVDQELKKEDRPKCLWLVGPSRTGKTEWARSLGRHIYWNGSIDLGVWDDEATYSIFDDFDWKFMPFKKQFGGAQRQFVVTDKYRRKRTIMWGKPSIYLWNDDNDPWDGMSAREQDWWRANVVRVVITEQMFSIENVWVEV